MKKELYKFLMLLTLTAASICAFTGCNKDDDDDDDTEYLEGELSFDVDAYLKTGQSITLIPSGGTHPDGGKIGYVWLMSWDSVKDTTKFVTDPDTVTGETTVVTPDQTGEYTITLYAYATDYYSLSSSVSVIVVDDSLNGSLSNTGIRSTNPKITDSRDGKTYYTTQIGNLLWTRNNMAFAESGVPYSNSPAMTNISGNYYTWEEAKTACPEGWRLPTEEDWLALGKELTGETVSSTDNWEGVAGTMMADPYFHNTKMWEYWPDVKISNTTGFCAIPAGYATDESKSVFKGAYDYAAFWSAGEYDSDKAIYRYINVKSPDVFVGYADKNNFRASVRCVKDAE